LNNERKLGLVGSSASEFHIYRNNQNMIAILVVGPNIDDNFLSRE
jgi:hypothetical protein